MCIATLNGRQRSRDIMGIDTLSLSAALPQSIELGNVDISRDLDAKHRSVKGPVRGVRVTTSTSTHAEADSWVSSWLLYMFACLTRIGAPESKAATRVVNWTTVRISLSILWDMSYCSPSIPGLCHFRCVTVNRHVYVRLYGSRLVM